MTSVPGCLFCALKHIGKARAKVVELCTGYPQEWWHLLGELAEAEDHLVEKYPALANLIRVTRKDAELHGPTQKIDFDRLFADIEAVAGLDVAGELRRFNYDEVYGHVYRGEKV